MASRKGLGRGLDMMIPERVQPDREKMKEMFHVKH